MTVEVNACSIWFLVMAPVHDPLNTNRLAQMLPETQGHLGIDLAPQGRLQLENQSPIIDINAPFMLNSGQLTLVQYLKPFLSGFRVESQGPIFPGGHDLGFQNVSPLNSSQQNW